MTSLLFFAKPHDNASYASILPCNEPSTTKFAKFEQTNFMSSTLKQELLDKIAATDDENHLQHIKEEIDYFTGEGKTNVLDELSPEDLQELKTRLKEPFGHETESYDDFKKATQRWRIK